MKIIEEEGLGLDVVSLGELHTALSAGFPASNIEMHGNAKSHEEISMAIKNGVGRIIADSENELELISQISKNSGKLTRIIIRVAPGVLAKTHTHIATGHTGSKFGFPIEGDMLKKIISKFMNDENIEIMGLHFHVGSQLFDPEDHICALKKVMNFVGDLKREINFIPKEINFGGGFGAVINPSIKHVPVELFTEPMMKILTDESKKINIPRPKAIIEPGRWIISESGITIYKVEVIKELPGITYVAVDGGMADNPRYALYGAEYEAISVKNPDGPIYEPENGHVSIVGKCCESGDILIEKAKLPKLKPGDLIAIYNTGAYTFSMASNYNRLLRPAVVFVNGGEARVVVKRQTLDDLLNGDLL